PSEAAGVAVARLDLEPVGRARFDGNDDGVVLCNRRFAVVDEQVVTTVLRVQVDLALPLDLAEGLARHRGHGGMLRVAAEAAPEGGARNRPLLEPLAAESNGWPSPGVVPQHRMPW